MHVELFGANIPVTILDDKQYVAVADLVSRLGLQGLRLHDRSQLWQIHAITQKQERGRLVTTLYLPLNELPLFLICPPISSIHEEIQHALRQFRSSCIHLLQSSLGEPFA